jgi:TRAP-type C4-dicarboxylate transport system substrate-binding protein
MQRSSAAVAALLIAAWLSPGSAAAAPKLILATALPSDNPLAAQILVPWAERANADAKGVLEIDVRNGMAIANLRNSYDRVVADVAQISWLTHSTFAGKFPRSEVGGLPFLADKAEEASVAMWRLYASGALDAEYKDVKPISIAVLSQAGIHLRAAPKSLDNLKGLKAIVATKEIGQVVSQLGIAQTSLPVTDAYEAVQRGTVDGLVLGWTAIQSFKLQEVTSYHANTSLGSATGMMFISRKAYNALPPDARKVIDEHSGEPESRALGKFWDRLDALGTKRVSAMSGQTVVNVPKEIEAKWRALAQPVIAAWAKAAPDGEKVLGIFRAQLAKVKSEAGG